MRHAQCLALQVLRRLSQGLFGAVAVKFLLSFEAVTAVNAANGFGAKAQERVLSG